MNDEPTSKAENIAKSVEKISNSKGIEAVGIGLGWGIAALAFALMAWALVAGSKWDGHLHPQTQCYDLKEISGKLVKLNTCTGEVTEMSTTKSIDK